MNRATMQMAQDYFGRIKELEKENAELKHNKKTVVHLAGCLEEKMKERIEELEKENVGLNARLNAINLLTPELEKSSKLKEQQITKATEYIEKVKYTLKKIIETVHNDRIDEYGARLVLIKDFAYECLEEIEK